MPPGSAGAGESKNQPPTRLRRLPSLDGLRACAILLVLLYHFTPNANADRGIQSLVFKLAEFGWSGVDLFFVLSGFLITRIILRARSAQLGLAEFYRNRLLRILPLYYLAVVTVMVLVPVVSSLYSPAPITDFLIYVLCLQNFSNPPVDINEWVHIGHFWSIGVEVQFYLFWPLLAYKLKQRNLIRLIVFLIPCLMLLRYSAILHAAPWEVTFGWTPFRMDALLMGCLVAIFHTRQDGLKKFHLPTKVILICTGSVLAWLIWRGWINEMVKPGDYPWNILLRGLLPFLVAIFYAALLIVSLTSNTLQKSLGSRWFQPLARYSYGIYVIHFLMAPIFRHVFSPLLSIPTGHASDLGLYVYFLICTTISTVMAALSYHLFEIRFLRLKHTGARHA